MAALRGLYVVAPSEHRSIESFRDLQDTDISRLASILSHQPPPTLRASASQHQTFRSICKADIKQLPSYLHTHKHYASYHSCPIHVKLNPRLMRSLLHWIQHEIDVTIPSLLHALTKTELLTPELQKPFQVLRETSGMWMKPDEYERFFDHPVNPRWAWQQDRCSACILSRLGGEADILTPLKAGMLANTCSSRPVTASKRHKYIDSLIFSGFVEQDMQRIFADAKHLGAKINDLAFRLHKSLQEDKVAAVSRPLKRRIEADRADSPTSVPDQSSRARDALSSYYSSIDELIKEYRRTVVFPKGLSEIHPEESSPTSINPGPRRRAGEEHAPDTLVPAPLIPTTERRAGRVISWHTTHKFDPFAENAPLIDNPAAESDLPSADEYAAAVVKVSEHSDPFAQPEDADIAKIVEGHHAAAGRSAEHRAASHASSLDVDAFLRRLSEEDRRHGVDFTPILGVRSGLRGSGMEE